MEDNIPTPELEPEQTQPKAILDGWMTRAELAKELGVCVDTLGRWQTMRIASVPCADGSLNTRLVKWQRSCGGLVSQPSGSLAWIIVMICIA
ncbi:hypothetical protein PsW64_03630 [Pseudovibrio sp. W64]|nr:hypothetical protein PsW64_03630 [Pseudovibrio sp. W64]